MDKSTSMGRLMLNALLSFAQFEREIIVERSRDKIDYDYQGTCSPVELTLGGNKILRSRLPKRL
ncbi:MAG: recombinase family protein [Pirellulaceae bacterium]|nr:recombinase family protein [Pirellulaceae bacterium]